MKPIRARLVVASALAALFCFSILSFAQAPSPEGRWEGAITLPGQELGVIVELALENEALHGTISIPLQNAKDLALTNLSLEGARVKFEIQGIPGAPTFDGTLAQDGAKIAGTFTQGGGSFPFTLSRAAAPADAAAKALDGFETWLDGARTSWQAVGLSIAIVKDGDMVWARGLGERDVESKLPATPDTLYAIGSSTKAFTTFALGTLVDEGKLDWDAPLRNYLPTFRLLDETVASQITPRDTVTHRSGLPRHDLIWYGDGDASRADLVASLAHVKANQPLRAKFQYNNLMYLTAGYLLEQRTGLSWEAAIRARILDPLGMNRTVFSIADMTQDADHAKGYRVLKDKIVAMPYRPITNMGPAGSINSSVNEMAKWIALHLGNGQVGERRLIGAATLADLHAPHMVTGETVERPEISQSSYGLGWFVYDYRGHRVVEHGGNIDGFSALVTLLPDDDLGMVVLINQNGSALPGITSRHALDRLLDLVPIDWNAEALARRDAGKAAGVEAEKKKTSVRKTGTKPSHPLADYAGTYEHPAYGKFAVEVQGSALTAAFHGIETPLEHWHYDIWNGAKAKDPVFEDVKLNFRTDVQGRVASVEIDMEPQVAAISFERKPDARQFDSAYLSRFVGSYDLAGQEVKVSLQAGGLVAEIAGQPLYHLDPALGGEFTLREAKVIRLRFLEDNGVVTAVELFQPDGIYTATRKR